MGWFGGQLIRQEAVESLLAWLIASLGDSAGAENVKVRHLLIVRSLPAFPGTSCWFRAARNIGHEKRPIAPCRRYRYFGLVRWLGTMGRDGQLPGL
ncbi:MAG: hypothetical protein EA381_17170 [Planctomycetaceae bacterium]|nr:MAG: hypothetical protein EA381_17170 [Planctomycetaceae bacterium]